MYILDGGRSNSQVIQKEKKGKTYWFEISSLICKEKDWTLVNIQGVTLQEI